jgi:hypothetical protein
MRAGVVEVVVHADDDVQRRAVLHRSGDDDLLHAPLQVRRERRAGAEPPGALEHDLDAESVPVDGSGVCGIGPAERAAVDDQALAVALHRDRPAPVH